MDNPFTQGPGAAAPSAVPPNPFTAGAPSGDTRGQSVLSVAGPSGGASDSLALKEKEIRAKERELEKRFEELQNRERALGGVKLKNWPKFYPIVYHHIDMEIPESGRKLVRAFYYSYVMFIFSLLWNWAALCADLHFVGAIAIGQWMLAIIFLLAGAPGAWFLWYDKIYNAAKDDSSLTYVKFFGGHMVHIGFLAVACISFPIGSNSYALAGIWPGIQFMHDGMMTLAVMYFVSAAFFGVQAVYNFVLILKARSFYRGRGHNASAAIAGAAAQSAGTTALLRAVV